ncbi:MAG: DUF1566 domain-containing protein [Bacteroidales bacterium]|nr:DUF1566 domain-containing protein [Bacteroidales bacterium]
MKKALLALICIATMLAAVSSLKAQEITITLNPEWNWISYPRADILDFTEAMGSFVPMEGDVIATQDDYAEYSDGEWYGTIEQFFPGWGYMYYSNRTESVTFSFQLQPVSPVTITTLEPTDVTATSAMVASEVTIPEGCHVFLRGLCWGTEPNPDIDGDHIAGDAVAGDQSYSLEGFLSRTTYYVRSYVLTDYGLAYSEERSFSTLSDSGDHEYVDLGLPSGTLWATCNVGSDAPEEYGDYFAWGETEPKETYYWSTYSYCNGSENSITKYCNNAEYGYNGFTDNLTTLLPEDDAASVNWGEDWRTPTREEWQELLDNTTSTWTTRNGKNGRLFTASNGNSLFFPAAGYCNGNSHYSESYNGYYWSNSLRMVWSGGAWGLFFASGSPDIDGHTRYSGFSVRPVRSSPQNNAPTGAINGKFTINADGDQVYFSQGNLQYIGSAGNGDANNTGAYWKFAENQWELLGNNGQVSISKTIDRDLFGWGTSNYDHGAICYQPWNTSSTNSQYYAYGDWQYNLYDQTGQADWGYNAIINGGDVENNGWRTLTTEEWVCVLTTRSASTVNGVANARFAKAVVADVYGLILFPDSYEHPLGVVQPIGINETGTGWNGSNYTAMEFALMEANGAIFLPSAGDRTDTNYFDNDHRGSYWSSSHHSSISYNAYFVKFSSYSVSGNTVSSNSYNGLHYGYSVRLVRDVE